MRTIFIGPLGGGKKLTNGANIKNFQIVKHLKKYIKLLSIIDTELLKRSLWEIFKLIFLFIFYRRALFILSLNSKSANKLIRLMLFFNPKIRIIYWVIGGAFGKMVKDGYLDVKIYRSLRNIIVEGNSMKRDLNSCGLNNIMVMPNFKYVTYSSSVKKVISKPLRFVFLSRIIPQKGCNLIVEAVEVLNSKGYSSDYIVDFYGPVDEEFKDIFFSLISKYENIDYRGFLNLSNKHNYENLSSYDAMLFPTFWPGEGCPGVIIDAYIAGIPVLASDWNLNKDYIKEGITGMLYSPQQYTSLAEAMEKCILNPERLQDYSLNIKEEVAKYNIDNVLNEANLRRYGIV